MSTTRTTQAVSRGIRRGVQMAVNPNADRLRQLQAQSRSQDRLDRAWQAVGQVLRASMTTQDRRDR